MVAGQTQLWNSFSFATKRRMKKTSKTSWNVNVCPSSLFVVSSALLGDCCDYSLALVFKECDFRNQDSHMHLMEYYKSRGQCERYLTTNFCKSEAKLIPAKSIEEIIEYN